MDVVSPNEHVLRQLRYDLAENRFDGFMAGTRCRYATTHEEAALDKVGSIAGFENVLRILGRGTY